MSISSSSISSLSHRHGDHTSGLNHLLKVNPAVKIYAPQENFGVFGAALPGTFYRRNDTLPDDMRYFDGRPPDTLRFGSPWPEANFTWITRTTEVARGFHLILLSGTWGADLEVREISLAIDTPDGIVLIVGCSHPTIEKIVEAAKSIINKPIHLILGGLHLLPAKDDQISSIAVSLRDNWGVRYLAPDHCTGEPAFAILKQTFGDHYVYAGLGTTVLLGPKITVKAEAGQPNKEAMDEEDLGSYREAMRRGPLRALLGKGGSLAQRQQ
jgi:7,8-dihydropterin-6-yl-methyl-4-(beta-D-ribofuranosyl)aminobenzene 5'-phosphate synthase